MMDFEATEDLGALHLMHREQAHRQMDPAIPIYRRIVDAGLAEQQAAEQKQQGQQPKKGPDHAQN